jgi:hypothetical protein
MAGNYIPTEDEKAAFNRDLTRFAREAEAEGDTFTARDLRLLALAHWPGENVRVKSDALGIGWVESKPDDYYGRDEQKQPAAGMPPTQGQAPQPAPLQPPAAHPNPAIEQARRDFQDIYGGHQGVKVITAHEGYDHSGRVVDAHLNAKGRSDGLDEQARAEIAALPKYGDPGWGKAKLTAIRQAAAQRAAAAQQGTPGRSEREAERAAVAGLEGREDGTWAEVRGNAGNRLLAEWNREQARKWTPKR